MFSEPMINEMIGNLESFSNSDFQIPMTVLIASAVISLLICLFGLKMVRLWNTISGLAIGTLAGIMIVYLAQTDMIVSLIIIGAAILIFAILAGVFRRFGAFLLCFGTVLEIIGMLKLQNLTWLAIVGIAGVIVAVLTMIWLEPLVIIVTSIAGGIGLGSSIVLMAEFDNRYIKIAIYAAAVILGLVVQFMMKSREIGRKEVKHSKKVKEEISIESEIDKARSVLDFDDEDYEDYDDEDEEE